MDNRLVEIILSVKKVAKEAGLNCSDDAIIELSGKFHISENIQKQKQPYEKKSSPPKFESPASDKQIDFLKKLKVTIPENLTKRRAMELIKERTEGENGRNRY